MRDRTEGRDLQAAGEKLSLGRGESPITANEMAGFSVRCPSCDHANPTGSHYCNRCGMPVHFEACGRCEAINLRGAPSCHKCGCVLPGSAIPEPASPAPVIVAAAPSQAASRIDSNAVSPPSVPEATPRRRPVGTRAALIALGLVLVAVPTYIATEHPASFQRVVDAITPRGNVATDSTAPTPRPAQAPPVAAALPSESVNAPGIPAAAVPEAASAAPPVASAPPSEVARDVKGSNAVTSAPVAPPAAKAARSSASKSSASRSRQGTSSRKPSTRKPATKSS